MPHGCEHRGAKPFDGVGVVEDKTLCGFAQAAATKQHKLGSSKPHKLIISLLRRLQI